MKRIVVFLALIAMIVSTPAYAGDTLTDIGKEPQHISGTTTYQMDIGVSSFELDAVSDGDGELSYASSDETIAIVNKTGKVTILREGEVLISVKASASENYEESEEFIVTLTIGKKPQTVSVAKAAYNVKYGTSSFRIDASSDGNGGLVYQSSNTAVARVNASGTVTIAGAGTADISVYARATDQYEESARITVPVQVKKADQTLTVTKKYRRVTGDAFNVKAQSTGTGTLKYASSNKKVAVVDSKGRVTLKGIGTAKVTVYAAANKNYNKSVSKIITIVSLPKAVTIRSLTNGSSNAATVKWTKRAGVTGYQVSYSVKSDFSKAKTVSVKGSDNVSRKVTSLQKESKYYFRVRAYKKVGGTTYYSSWSSKESVKITKGTKKMLSKVPSICVKSTTTIDYSNDKISWNKISGVSGYQVYIKVGSKDWKLVRTTTASTFTYQASYGKAYQYKVRAFKDYADGSRDYSQFSSIQIKDHYTVPKMTHLKNRVIRIDMVYDYNSCDVTKAFQQKLLSKTGGTIDASKVTWNSEAPSIAKINKKGKITVVKPGMARMTAKYKGKTYEFKVIVTGMSLSSSWIDVQYGETKTITLKLGKSRNKEDLRIRKYQDENQATVKWGTFNKKNKTATIRITGYSSEGADVYYIIDTKTGGRSKPFLVYGKDEEED